MKQSCQSSCGQNEVALAVWIWCARASRQLQWLAVAGFCLLTDADGQRIRSVQFAVVFFLN